MSGTKCPLCGAGECASQRVEGSTAYLCGTVCGDGSPMQGVMCMEVCRLRGDLSEALDALEEAYEFICNDVMGCPKFQDRGYEIIAKINGIREKHGRV